MVNLFDPRLIHIAELIKLGSRLRHWGGCPRLDWSYWSILENPLWLRLLHFGQSCWDISGSAGNSGTSSPVRASPLSGSSPRGAWEELASDLICPNTQTIIWHGPALLRWLFTDILLMVFNFLRESCQDNCFFRGWHLCFPPSTCLPLYIPLRIEHSCLSIVPGTFETHGPLLGTPGHLLWANCFAWASAKVPMGVLIRFWFLVSGVFCQIPFLPLLPHYSHFNFYMRAFSFGWLLLNAAAFVGPLKAFGFLMHVDN